MRGKWSQSLFRSKFVRIAMHPPVIHIIDDDAALRAALQGLLHSMDFETRDYASMDTFLSADRPDRPGCVLVDVRLPDGNGLDLKKRMTSVGIMHPVVVMTGYGDVPMSVRAMKDGAVDFLTKPIRDQDLLDAVSVALSRDVARRRDTADLRDLRQCYETLTPRERQVMVLIARGRLNKQAAAELDISETTTKAHRRGVMQKMQARTLADLVRMADRLQI